MKTLLHICCAPCSIYCIDSLRAEGIEPVGYWYNPNIHPYTEYQSRLDGLRIYAAMIDLAVIEEDHYGLRDFVQAVAGNLDHRCGYCYAQRLEHTAAYAAANGFDSFTTTLLVSPYQDHALLRQIGEAIAKKHGITFLYRDFRPGFRQGQARAKELGLYMQKYCGCIFSEEERYLGGKPKKEAPAVVEPQARLLPHDPAWADCFDREIRAVQAAFQSVQPELLPIGSASVPGMMARPILDLMLGVPSLPPQKRYAAALRSMGYTLLQEAPEGSQRFYKAGDGEAADFMVYLVQREGAFWREALRLQGRLAGSEALAAQYTQHRLQLIENGSHQPQSYAAGKAPFIRQYSQKKLPR